MKARDALRDAIHRLRDAGVESPERDARKLLAFALGTSYDRLTVDLPDDLPSEAAAIFEDVVSEREIRRPMSQLLGGRWFYGRFFTVTVHVLDPRPETERLVEVALSEPFERVLDLGTGSGCILVTLLAERPEAAGVGTDVSPEAVLIAGVNAERHGVADRVVLPVSDWWDDVGGRYDLIVSNPPYIAESEMAVLQPEVRIHEPREALTDEADGLSAYRRIASGALDHLIPGGRLIVEIGPTQGEAVTEIFGAAGLEDVRIETDLDGRDRIVRARRAVG